MVQNALNNVTYVIAAYSLEVYPQYCNIGTITLIPSKTSTIVENTFRLLSVSALVLYVRSLASAALLGGPGSF